MTIADGSTVNQMKCGFFGIKIPTNQKHYQDLGSECHQYGISTLVTQTLFCEGLSGNLVKRRLFSQAKTSKGAKCFGRDWGDGRPAFTIWQP